MMGKALLVFFCCLVVPEGLFAAGNNLYDISTSTILLTQKFNYCITRENSCTVEDYLELKAAAENSLRDSVQLLKSTNVRMMAFTPRQAGTLVSTMGSLKAEMTAADSPSQACGTALQMLIMAWLSFCSAIVSLISPAAGAAVLPAGTPLAGLAVFLAHSLPAALFAFITGIVFALLGLVLYPACLL